jgi:UDP-N-acetylmuramyl pentapeptide phosphotransferase/UDP-N-acetylglucosamine-1-phosphate transferase
MSLNFYIIYFISISCISYFSFKVYKNLAAKRALYSSFEIWETTNQFNSTKKKITVGSGIIFYILFVFATFVIIYFNNNFYSISPNRIYLFYISLTIATFVSFKDDISPIDPKIRLFVHFLCVYLCLPTLELNDTFVPLKFLMLICLLLWVYIINITNFIDGSDGILSLEAIKFFFCIFLYNYYYDIFNFQLFISLIILPIILCFLIFYNKPPAKIYMGDAGSIFIGFVIGFVFIKEILDFKYYVIIPAAYIFLDCTITIIKKIFKGYLPWVRLGDYFFLIPIRMENYNKTKLFKLHLIFTLVLILILICFIIFSKYFIILAFLTNLIQLKIYSNKKYW